MEYDYNNTNNLDQSYMPQGFQGNIYNLSYKWLDIIPEPSSSIKILEIGSYHGANICSYIKTYAKHIDTQIHCVDPWVDYCDYNEYKNTQTTNYSIFLQNISKLSPIDLHKIYIHRGLSEDIVPLFSNDFFDIIYIDGNHTKKYVFEDSIMAIKKIKPGGWIIFDDIHDNEVNEGIHLFLNVYNTYFKTEMKMKNSQLFIQRNN